jgi:hypothetical protein
MEKKWNWQKARISINPGENKLIDKMANSFEQLETIFGFSKTRKVLKLLFFLIVFYLISDLISNFISLFNP